MQGLYICLNDYDQPEYVSMLFEQQPSADELLKLISSEYAYITEKKISDLLSGKTIYDTSSGKAEPWCYTTFKLRNVEPKTWL